MTKLLIGWICKDTAIDDDIQGADKDNIFYYTAGDRVVIPMRVYKS
jgi:hypothetical protein